MKRLTLALGATTLTVMLLCLCHVAGAQGDSWGTVKGKITWGGKGIPKQAPIAAVATSPDKAACMKDGNVVVDEMWVVNPKNKGLRWTFVWLANTDPKNKKLPINPSFKAPKDDKVVMDQPLCAFLPHATARA